MSGVSNDFDGVHDCHDNHFKTEIACRAVSGVVQLASLTMLVLAILQFSDMINIMNTTSTNILAAVGCVCLIPSAAITFGGLGGHWKTSSKCLFIASLYVASFALIMIGSMGFHGVIGGISKGAGVLTAGMGCVAFLGFAFPSHAWFNGENHENLEPSDEKKRDEKKLDQQA